MRLRISLKETIFYYNRKLGKKYFTHPRKIQKKNFKYTSMFFLELSSFAWKQQRVRGCGYQQRSDMEVTGSNGRRSSKVVSRGSEPCTHALLPLTLLCYTIVSTDVLILYRTSQGKSSIFCQLYYHISIWVQPFLALHIFSCIYE